MKCDKHTMLLYAVTDRAWTGRETLRQQVEDALKGGVTCVQLREKELDDAAFLQEAMELSALCRSYGVPFILNDNVEIAIKCHADGIHVGQEDMAAADDETHGTEYTYRVDIYSKRDYIALLRRVKQALKAAGFYGLVIDPEVYERDTGFYHVPIEAKYYEQTEV